MEKEIRYRAYYKDTMFPTGFWYSEAYSEIDGAREVLNARKERDDFIEGHIKEEITTKRIVE